MAYALQPQVEWFWAVVARAEAGDPALLLDMALNHEVAAIKSRAADIVATRHWDRVTPLIFDGGAA